MRTEKGPTVRFTGRLNGVTVTLMAATAAPTVAAAQSADVTVAELGPGVRAARDQRVTLPAGQAVRIVFRRNSDPDQVTGRVYRDEVEE